VQEMIDGTYVFTQPLGAPPATKYDPITGTDAEAPNE
jgi:hypothetical protein